MGNRYLYGLDISLKNTGITIYDLDSKEFVFIDSFSTQKIYTTKENKGLHLNAVKLKKISDWIEDIIEKYPPYIVAIERMFSRFQNETQTIAKATGVIQKALWNVPQYLYSPKSVKATIIHGNASKEMVSIAIKTKYNDITFKNEPNNTEEINGDSNNEELNIDGEIERLIEYIKDSFNIDVSEDSASIIKEMVEEAGIVSTLLAINGVIEDYDKLDMSFIIVREAKSRL